MKAHDERLEHDKLVEAGPLAEHLDDRAILYANKNLTDGFIRASKVRTLVDWHGVFTSDARGKPKPVDPMVLAEKLCEVDRWRKIDGGFEIHDYLDVQRSKDQILADREKAANRQRRHRTGKRNGVTDDGSHADSNGGSHAVTSPSGHAGSSPGSSADVTGALEVRRKNGEQHEGRGRAAA